MSRRFRLLYFFIVVAIFFIIAPLLVGYASGWRFDFDTKIIKKVGGITIITNPRGASVQLNRKIAAKKTPLVINNLIPGNYTINLEKGGYYSWTRTVNVAPGQGIRIDDLYLLKKQPTNLEQTLGSATSAVASPDESKIALWGDGQLRVFDLASSKTIYTKKQMPDIQEMSWSSSSDKLAIRQAKNDFLIIDLFTPSSIVNLSYEFNLAILNTAWSPTDGTVIYASTNDGTYRLNIFQRTKTRISDKADIRWSNGNIYFHEQPDTLEITDSNNQTKQKIQLTPEYHLEYSQPANDTVYILDTIHQKLFIYHVSENTYDTFPEAVTGFSYSENKKQALLFNSTELWIWDITKDERTLVARISDKVITATWLQKQQYIFYAQEKKGLTITEAVETQPNTYSIPLHNVRYLGANSSSDKIWAIADSSLYILSF